MDLLHKRKSQRRARCLNNGDNSWRPTLNCSELGLLGKRAAPILLFAGCHDLSQSCCFGLQPFPDSSKPCLPTTMPHLIFCPQPATWQERGHFEKRSLNWKCRWSAWMGLPLRTSVSGAWRWSAGIPRMLDVDYSLARALLPPLSRDIGPSEKFDKYLNEKNTPAPAKSTFQLKYNQIKWVSHDARDARLHLKTLIFRNKISSSLLKFLWSEINIFFTTPHWKNCHEMFFVNNCFNFFCFSLMLFAFLNIYIFLCAFSQYFRTAELP